MNFTADVTISLHPDHRGSGIFLDLAPADAHGRLARSLDRLEQEGIDFHQAVHDSYHTMAAADPDTWVTIDAAGSPDEIEAQIWDAVEGRLG